MSLGDCSTIRVSGDATQDDFLETATTIFMMPISLNA
jgi:hypothetical protein